MSIQICERSCHITTAKNKLLSLSCTGGALFVVLLEILDIFD